MIGHVTKVMLTTGAQRAGVVNQNGNGRAKRRANEGLPEVEGPVLAVGGDLGKETEGGGVEVTGLDVLGLRLEDLHFAPEGRVGGAKASLCCQCCRLSKTRQLCVCVRQPWRSSWF